jgi:phage terminase large subunit-like protein
MKRRGCISSTKAQEAVDFFRLNLVHTKGRWAGVRFNLMPWQENDIIRPLFGTLNKDGNRTYRTAYIEIPRKNGKSELAAGIALKLLMADGEQGGEIYGAACDRDQAGLVFHVAADMVRRNPDLASRCRIIDSQKRIIYPKTNSVYRAIPADAAGSHGFNASGVIFDELHAQPNRELWDVLTTSTSAREQPLVFAITTAGFDRTSICWELHERAVQVLDGTLELPSFFAYIRSLPEEADWTDEKLWAIANPAIDEFRSRDELRDMVDQAIGSPAMQNTVRRLYFSQWTNSETRWFDPTQWRACGGLIGDMSGKDCYGGLDLASTTDFAAWVLYFPEGHKVITQIFMPADVARKPGPMRAQFEAWARNGELTLTPGNVIDYDFIKAQVLKDAEKYRILEVGYDPWSAAQIAVQLEGEGIEMVGVRQGFATLSAPAKLLETLVAKGELNHGGHGVLAWMADNVVVETDAGANIKPSKKHSTQKIDGIAALVTALERAMRAEMVSAPSVFSFTAADLA